MKSMKKRIVVVISLLLVFAFTLVACGGSGNQGSTQSQTPAATTSGNTQGQAPAGAAAASTQGQAPVSTSNFDASKNISVLAREDGSGTKTAFMEIIGLKGKADPENVIIQTGTAGILTEVKGNPTAIAYESLGYITNDVKMLKVNGVEATVENIKSGSYKISRPLSVVYQEDVLNGDVNKAFLTFLQSSDAQKIISEEGYVSVVDNAPAYTIDGSLSGTIDISGSTSLQPLMTELAEVFEDLQPNVSVTVGGGGSGTGYKNADEGVSEFGMISEEFSLEKAPLCTHSVVCKDGIAVIIHVSNPLDDISMDQLKNVYDVEAEADAISAWNALIK